MKEWNHNEIIYSKSKYKNQASGAYLKYIRKYLFKPRFPKLGQVAS